jgi:hypothetical protein
LVQYTFEEEEHAVLVRPHGNSKHKESFLRTMPSALQKLKKVAQNLTPKFAICEVSSSSGGLASAPSVGSLPRNRQQVSNIRRRTGESNEPSIGKKKDPLFAVMTLCKESEGRNTQDHFVRIVTGAPEPMTLLIFDWTLKRFCTRESHVICLWIPPSTWEHSMSW